MKERQRESEPRRKKCIPLMLLLVIIAIDRDTRPRIPHTSTSILTTTNDFKHSNSAKHMCLWSSNHVVCRIDPMHKGHIMPFVRTEPPRKVHRTFLFEVEFLNHPTVILSFFLWLWLVVSTKIGGRVQVSAYSWLLLLLLVFSS